MQNEKLNQIRQDKELEYGSFSANMNSIGKAWSSLLGLETDIPGWMVSNMFVVSKLIRTNKQFKQDTYDDALNYLHQAELMQKIDDQDDESELLKKCRVAINKMDADNKQAAAENLKRDANARMYNQLNKEKHDSN